MAKKKKSRRYPLTVKIDIDKDGKVDVIRIYNRKHGSKKVKVANVKFGTTEMGRRKKKS